MTQADTEARWERLQELLAPIHVQALATARRLCRSGDDGDDLYQESIRRAFDKLPSLRDPGRFRSWFFAVLLSVHRSRSRRGFWKRFLSLEAALRDGFDPAGDDGRREAERHRGAARASEALASLPPAQREAVVLFDLEGFSLDEVAGLQGASIPAVKTRLSRGRARLREYYRKRDWVSPRNPDVSALLGAVPLLTRRESGHE